MENCSSSIKRNYKRNNNVFMCFVSCAHCWASVRKMWRREMCKKKNKILHCTAPADQCEGSVVEEVYACSMDREHLCCRHFSVPLCNNGQRYGPLEGILITSFGLNMCKYVCCVCVCLCIDQPPKQHWMHGQCAKTKWKTVAVLLLQPEKYHTILSTLVLCVALTLVFVALRWRLIYYPVCLDPNPSIHPSVHPSSASTMICCQKFCKYLTKKLHM